MQQIQYAFVVKAPGYDAATHHAVLESPEFRTRIVGVQSRADALTTVDRLVMDGVEIIELGGGFSPIQAAEIRKRAGAAVSVGLVAYSGEEF